MTGVPDLTALVGDPVRVADLSHDDALALLADLELVRVALWQHLLAGRHADLIRDRLLTIDEAAARLATTKDWLRRHSDLPFVV